MQNIATALTFLVLHFIQPVFANSSSDLGPVKVPVPMKEQSTNDQKLTNKKVWMENIQNNLPALMCQKGQYFANCFSVENKECIELNKLFVQACLNNVALSLPTELNDQEAQHWGAVMGKCTLDVFEKFLSTKKLKKPECTEKATSKK